MLTLWLLLGAVGCADMSLNVRPPTKPTDDDSDSKSADIKEEEVKVDAFAIFEERVHPLLEENCSLCHATLEAPKFAIKSAKKSLEILLEAKKINRETPEKSRVVERLAKENHNCWSDCAENAEELLEAIEKWAGASSGADKDFALQTEAIALDDAKLRDRNPGTIVVEAESMPAAENATPGTDPTHESIVLAADQTAPLAVTLTKSITVTEAGAYQVWIEAKGPAVNWSVQAGSDPALQAAAALAEDWKYVPLKVGEGFATLNLPSGSVDLTFSASTANLAIDRIVLTNAVIATEDAFVPAAHVPDEYLNFEFDLSELLDGVDAKLSVDVERVHAEALKVSNLKLDTAETDIMIGGINILIDGLLDERNATFREINTTVKAPGAELSTASTTILIEAGQTNPTLSFGFDVLSTDLTSELFE